MITQDQKHLGLPVQTFPSGPVECLGHKYESDAARREHFTKLLREKLKDPVFRQVEGFPSAEDEDILRLSDPPFFTACPNPFLIELVAHYGKAYQSTETYNRDPFAIDVSVGKTDALYKAHSYHTKVPHLAIVPLILHYTNPGDVVLDGFCGSGMTGVATQWCGTAPDAYRRSLEADWKREGLAAPTWGARRALLNDLSPAATLIAANYTAPFDIDQFEKEAQKILDEAHKASGWMYDTLHADKKTKGLIEYAVWSEIFACSECATEIVFSEHAVDEETNRIAAQIECPRCKVIQTKERMQLRFETVVNSHTGATERRVKRVPVLISYRIGKNKYTKKPDEDDVKILRLIDQLPSPRKIPLVALPDCQMTRVGRMATTETNAIWKMFLNRPAHALSDLWARVQGYEDYRLRSVLIFFIEQAIWGMSVLERYAPTHFSQVNQYMSGVFYVASRIVDVSPWYILDGKLKRLLAAFRAYRALPGHAFVTTGSCTALPVADCSVDYIFTDPPFGENIYYSDLNFLVESWHRVMTDSAPEAIVDRAKGKALPAYQDLMRRCFAEYFRVLKPRRWMTVVFSNSSNAVWRSIQEGLGTAGFVVADVRTLDKKQRSFKQITSTAVKQDLVISAYKPSEALETKFVLGSTTEETAWAFVREHLSSVPKFVGRAIEGEVISERTPQMLHDRMVAYHVQHGVGVPIGGPLFFAGLALRFSERDGMYFLPEQVADYDRRRASVSEVKQLSIFVVDEASAIQWLRRELTSKPRSAQELTPVFMRELQSWAKHEKTIELRDILRENFLEYDGVPPVPSQIHRYLRTNFKELRSLSKEDAGLVAKAKGRWYVPDPNKALDIEKLREKALLREFEDYKASKAKKLKLLRTETVRVGFKAAYDAKDYATIVSFAQKLPERILQEDAKLLMYYDVACMRVGK